MLVTRDTYMRHRSRAACVRNRLSLPQRERMKVRDCFAVAPRVRTRSLATRYRALGEPDDSRIATQGCRGEPGIPSAFDREFGLHGSYAHRRPIRPPALRSDNRNPTRNRRTDADGEICSPRNFGSASFAKECVQVQSPSFAAIERDPQQSILKLNASSKEAVSAPHLNPLPASGARRTPAIRFERLMFSACRAVGLPKAG
jgi:hypothetical protein